MCELSIIVPVYKAEKYLERTVEALLTQQNVDYEVLLVEDGSPDKSGEICDLLCQKNSKIRCLHISNGGPSRARNIGISHTSAKYIAFCDSDDVPAYNMYGQLLEALKEQKSQLSLCDIFTERDNKNFGFPWSGNRFFIGRECQEELLASMLGNRDDDDMTQPIWGSSVRSIYLRDIIERYNVRFPEDIRFAEDLVFNVHYLAHCSSAFILNKVLYRYMLNGESLMNSFKRYNPDMFNERLALIKYIENAVKPIDKDGELEIRFKTSQRCYIHECIGNCARSIPNFGYIHAFKEIRDITRNTRVKELFSGLKVRDNRKKLIYNLIHLRCNALLLLYYAIRLK